MAMRRASRFTSGNGHHAEPETGGTESDAGSGTAGNEGESNSEVPSVTRHASGLTGPVRLSGGNQIIDLLERLVDVA